MGLPLESFLLNGDDMLHALVFSQQPGARDWPVPADPAQSEVFAVDLFAEGPTPDWALPVPSQIAGAPAGQQRFAFELDGLPSGAKPEGATLTLNLSSN